MRILIIFGAFVIFWGSASALRCWHCDNQGSLSACIKNGHLQRCQSNQQACETVVRRNGFQFTYFKHCKQRRACLNNQLQHFRRTPTPQKCDGGACFCCCFTDECGKDTNDCTGRAGVPITQEMPAVSTIRTVLPESIVCSEPPNFAWPDGDIECLTSLPDGTFALGTTCEYLCSIGLTTAEGSNNYTKCQRANPNDPSSKETIWFPPPPDCVADFRQRCTRPPLWESGFGGTGSVSCEAELPSGGWNIDAKCSYTCPKGFFLIGSDTAICSFYLNPESSKILPSFQPSHPCCEPPCKSFPADLLFVLDQSNSIGQTSWPLVTNFVADVMRELRDNPSIHVAVRVYGSAFVEESSFKFTENTKALEDKVRSIPYVALQKGTNTVEALRAARSIAFTPEYNDRADAPDYVVVVTDGVSSSNPRMGAANLTVVAKLLHEQTNAVFAIGINVPEESTELASIASDPAFIGNLNDEEDPEYIISELDRLTTGRCDPICDPSHQHV